SERLGEARVLEQQRPVEPAEVPGGVDREPVQRVSPGHGLAGNAGQSARARLDEASGKPRELLSRRRAVGAKRMSQGPAHPALQLSQREGGLHRKSPRTCPPPCRPPPAPPR